MFMMRNAESFWASHDGDGFSYGALIMEEQIVEIDKPEPERAVSVFQNTTTLNDLWAETPTQRTWRI